MQATSSKHTVISLAVILRGRNCAI